MSKKVTFFLLTLLGFTVYAESITGQSLTDSLVNEIDPSLVTPEVNISPLPIYSYQKLDYGMTIGIERTPNGRIWACWVAGGDNEDAFFVLNWSDDAGETWSDPKVVIDPHDPSLNKKRRTLVGNLWTDPWGRLWLFFDQGLTYFDGRSGVWATVCHNPDDKSPSWTIPIRIWHGCSLSKPIVLSTGEWLLPVSLWDRSKIKDTAFKDSFHELDSLRMAHVFISKDNGATWVRQGGIRFPKANFDEHNIIERKDGTIWMTARTNDGIWQSVSDDKGRTWSIPEKYLNHINSKHFIKRLQSGRLLLVKHGGINDRTNTRSKLMAFLSEDEGNTWRGGLMLDERRGVSYPDGFQASDGTIYISYDRNRDTDGEILMISFNEEDVLAKKVIRSGSKQRLLISKPEGLDKLPPPSINFLYRK